MKKRNKTIQTLKKNLNARFLNLSCCWVALMSFGSGYSQNCLYLADDIYPGTYGSAPSRITEFGSALYFNCTGSSAGAELWKFENGNATIVADIFPGTFSSMPNDLVVMGSYLYFTANDGTHGKEIWRYDGSTASLLIDLNPGSASSQAINLTVLDNVLYFSASDGTTGSELWKYDGVSITQIEDIYPGSGSSFPAEMVELNGDIYFTANDGVNGLEFYKYDGSTVTEFDIYPGVTSSEAGELTIFNSSICFHANDGVHGMELFVYDGTSMVMYEINPTGNGNPWDMEVCMGELLFRGYESTNGTELWKYDGSGVNMIANIRPGSLNSIPHNFHEVSGLVYFAANDGSTGNELWVYDGVNVNQAIDLYPGGSNSMNASTPEKFVSLNGELFFVATNPTSGYELWKFDGLTATLGKDIMAGSFASNPAFITIFDDKVFFMAESTTTGSELWVWNPGANLDTSLSIYTCSAYNSPGGDYYSTSGAYNFIDTIPSAICPGCDSLISVNLEITDEPSSNAVIVACGDYTSPAGNYYYIEGNYTFTDVIPSIGCPGLDSLIHVDLTLVDDINTNLLSFEGVLLALQSGANYQWLDCDNAYAEISGANDQDFVSSVPGNFACEISIGICVDTSACYNVIPLNLSDLSNEKILVYPNPATDLIKIDFPFDDMAEFKLYDLSGKLIQIQLLSKGMNECDVHSVEHGIYYFVITLNHQDFTGKITIR